MAKILSWEELDSILSYDPDTAVFRWKYPKNNFVKAGDVAGHINNRGYTTICIRKRSFLAHRLSWLYHYGECPKMDLDHINGVRTDNRIINLREATDSQNQANRTIPKNNTSGFKGVTYHASTGKWRAAIRFKGNSQSLGLYWKAEDAAAAYAVAARNLYGEFARTA